MHKLILFFVVGYDLTVNMKEFFIMLPNIENLIKPPHFVCIVLHVISIESHSHSTYEESQFILIL